MSKKHRKPDLKAFQKVEALYEELGKKQALWAVMTYPEYRDDQNMDMFFESGELEIDLQMKRLEELNIYFERGSCIDFGCGVGRLTNALASYFNQVTGVDVSSTMIKKAEELKRNEKALFLLNKKDNLSLIESNTIDFIYSDKTIQHIPYPASKRYIQDFYRILKPGGVAVFMVHKCNHAEEGSLRFNYWKWIRETVRPFFKKLRGKPPVQIHPISRQNIEKFVKNSGGEVIHCETDQSYTKRKSGNLRTWYRTRKLA